MLPNLSSLRVEPLCAEDDKEYDVSIEAPLDANMPQYMVDWMKRGTNDELEKSVQWSFNIGSSVTLFQYIGFIFWKARDDQVNAKMKAVTPDVDPLLHVFKDIIPSGGADGRDKMKDVLDFRLEALAKRSGAFNYSWDVTRSAALLDANAYKLFEWVDKVRNDTLAERVTMRVSKLGGIKMHFRNPANRMNASRLVSEDMNMELFLTLYAASVGIGPKVYACKLQYIEEMVPFKDPNTEEYTRAEIYYPRVAYALETGDSSLYDAIDNVCKPNAYRFSNNFGSVLMQLMQRTADAHLILLDIKTENMIAFLDIDGVTYNNLKMIDFGPDFTSYAPNQSVNDIMFLNCIMLFFYVGSSEWSVRRCFYDHMEEIKQYVEREFYSFRNDSASEYDVESLIHAIKTRQYIPSDAMNAPNGTRSLFDDNVSFQNLIVRMYRIVNHYALEGKRMDRAAIASADPPILFDPSLGRFQRNEPLIVQLLDNVLQQYEEDTET